MLGSNALQPPSAWAPKGNVTAEHRLGDLLGRHLGREARQSVADDTTISNVSAALKKPCGAAATQQLVGGLVKVHLGCAQRAVPFAVRTGRRKRRQVSLLPNDLLGRGFL